jgi:hypothetical protein
MDKLVDDLVVVITSLSALHQDAAQALSCQLFSRHKKGSPQAAFCDAVN